MRYEINVSTGEVTEHEDAPSGAALSIPPTSCSAWQIRKALNAAGRRQDVEDYIASPTATQIEKDGWEYATEFKSDDQFVLSVGSLLGLDEAAVYEFILGASQL